MHEMRGSEAASIIEQLREKGWSDTEIIEFLLKAFKSKA